MQKTQICSRTADEFSLEIIIFLCEGQSNDSSHKKKPYKSAKKSSSDEEQKNGSGWNDLHKVTPNRFANAVEENWVTFPRAMKHVRQVMLSLISFGQHIILMILESS